MQSDTKYRLNSSFSWKKTSNEQTIIGYNFYIHKSDKENYDVCEFADLKDSNIITLKNEHDYLLVVNIFKNILDSFKEKYLNISNNIYINALSCETIFSKSTKKQMQIKNEFLNFVGKILNAKSTSDNVAFRMFMKSQFHKRDEVYVEIISIIKYMEDMIKENKIVFSINGVHSYDFHGKIKQECFNTMIENHTQSLVVNSENVSDIQKNIFQRKKQVDTVKKVYEIFTDGSLKKDGSCFGYSAVITELENGQHTVIQKLAGMKKIKCKMHTQLAELTAIEDSLNYLKENIPDYDNALVRVYCDNLDCVESLKYTYKWAEKKNAGLLFDLTNRIKAIEMTKTFLHIKGHFGHTYNEMADKLAGWARGFKEEKFISVKNK